MAYLPFVVQFGKFNVLDPHDAVDTSIAVSGQTVPPVTMATLPMYAVWWDANAYDDPEDDPNVEIVNITAISGTTLTVERGVDGTLHESTHNAVDGDYKLMPVPTMWFRTFIENKLIGLIKSGFRVTLATVTPSIARVTEYPIPFGTVTPARGDFDLRSEWNVSAKRWEVRNTGKYHLHLSLEVAAAEVGQQYHAILVKNGSVYLAQKYVVYDGVTTNCMVECQTLASLAAGDYVKPIFYHDSVAAKVLQAVNYRTFFEGFPLYGGA